MVRDFLGETKSKVTRVEYKLLYRTNIKHHELIISILYLKTLSPTKIFLFSFVLFSVYDRLSWSLELIIRDNQRNWWLELITKGDR